MRPWALVVRVRVQVGWGQENDEEGRGREARTPEQVVPDFRRRARRMRLLVRQRAERVHHRPEVFYRQARWA